MKIISIAGKYLCKVKRSFTLQQLENYLDEHLGMRKESFAERYSKQIFRDLFGYARDLQREYHDYYALEYNSFEQFLYQKELWECWVIDELALESEQTVLELRPNLANYNASTLMDHAESCVEIINQVLEEMPL